MILTELDAEIITAPSDLQLPLWQWGAGNVYLLALLRSPCIT